MIAAYYSFQCLSDEIRAANGIRSKARLDCVAFADRVSGGYKGLLPFLNKKGQLCFYLTPARDVVNSNSKRRTDWTLTQNSLNLSSIYKEDTDYPDLGYGYPNHKRRLSNGQPNPVFEWANDGFLFLSNSTYSAIELLIIPDGRHLITAYYNSLIDGAMDEQINEMRQQARPYYPYQGM